MLISCLLEVLPTLIVLALPGVVGIIISKSADKKEDK